MNGAGPIEPNRSQTALDAGLPRAKEEKAKSEVSQWRPAGYGPVADATDPYRTSRIPTPPASSREGMGLNRPVFELIEPDA